MVDGFADVLGCKVGREAGGETFADAEEGSARVGQSLHVSLVCDESCVAVSEQILLRFYEVFLQFFESGACFCGNRDNSYLLFVNVLMLTPEMSVLLSKMTSF